MNPNRFFIPGYMGMTNNMMSASPMIRMASNTMANPVGRMAGIGSTTRGMGLFSRITNGIRSVNWSGLLNNANKTLNVVNQAIPLVRQAGPMVNNMRSMMKIAKAFGSETNGSRRNNGNNMNINNGNNLNSKNINSNINNNFSNNSDNNIDKKNDGYTNGDSKEKKEVQNSNSPNFFV